MGEMIVEITTHKGEKRIALFQRSTSGTQADARIRQLPGRLYSVSRKMWHIAFRDDYKDYLTDWFSEVPGIGIHFKNEGSDHDKNIAMSVTKKSEPVPTAPKTANSPVEIVIDKQKKCFYLDHGNKPELFKIINATRKGFWLKKQKMWRFPGENDIYKMVIDLLQGKGYRVEKRNMDQQFGNGKKFKNKYRIPSVRLQNWDYGWDGYYYVTICTSNRECFFGEIVKGEMELSGIGELTTSMLLEIPKRYEYANLDEFIVMPNHIHAIIKINNRFTWQSRFHDRIIRNDQQYQQIKNYIINNPENWNNDSLNT